MNTIILITIAFCGVMFGVFLARQKKCNILSRQAEKKVKNKEKILNFLSKNKKIRNNDVEKMLSVSDATATRYLDELEKEGKLKQTGTTGRFVYYCLK